MGGGGTGGEMRNLLERYINKRLSYAVGVVRFQTRNYPPGTVGWEIGELWLKVAAIWAGLGLALIAGGDDE